MKALSYREAGSESDYVAKGDTEEELTIDGTQHSIKNMERQKKVWRK